MYFGGPIGVGLVVRKIGRGKKTVGKVEVLGAWG